MMSSSEVREIQDAGNEIQDGLALAARRFDKIESDGVNLQCVNSTDFMVGKQTNFNGPVTIINYADGNEAENPLQGDAKPSEVVIKDRVMAPGVASSIESFVKKKAEEELKQFQLSKGMDGHRSRADSFCKRNFLKIPVFAWSLIIFIVIAGMVTLGIELSDESTEHHNRTYLEVEGERYRLVSRDEWGAVPPRSVVPVNKSLPYVVISHSASKTCFSEPQCQEYIRNAQAWNMGEHCRMPDIKYNFMVGGDGAIYVGRDWEVRNENSGRVSNQNVDFSFVGNFNLEPPTPGQVKAVAALIRYALQNGYVAEKHTIIPAKILNGSQSPDDEYPEDTELIPGENRNYTLYRRKHWGAAEERSSVAIELPVPYVIISSTNGKECDGLKECGKILRNLQSDQMKASQADIYPNFLVSGDGSVYEGRGWHKRNAFLGFANNRNIEISFIGDFRVYVKPTENQTEAAKALVEYALKEGMIVDTYQLCPASARGILLPQEDPTMGHNVYEVIKNWRNFEPDPYGKFYTNPP